MKDNVALIGMSGTLKTAIAKKLSVLLDKRCVDTDELIEYELSMSIKDLFEKMGEEYFRRTEEKTVCQVSDFYNIVVSTGGGVVLSEKSMLALRRTCTIVCLTATADTLYERLKDDQNRPLLSPVTKSKIIKYYISRKGMYEKWADYVVVTDNKTADQLALDIKNILLK